MKEAKIDEKDLELKRRIAKEFFAPQNAYEKLKLILKINEKLIEKGLQVLHPCLVGGSSSGKSSRVYQLGKEWKKDVREVIVYQKLPEDIAGIPKIEEEVTKYTFPEWIRASIVFFDEIDKVIDQPHKIAPLLSIMSDRRLHGRILNNTFVFAAQVAEDIRFLEYLNEREEYSDALSRRLLIIPCYYTEAIEYLKNKGRKRIKINGGEIDKKIREWSLKFYLPAHDDYIFEFTREYTKILPDYMFKNKEERDQYVKQVLEELFYYLNPEGVLSAIEDALDSGDETRTEQEEQLYHYEIVKNFKKYAIPQVYHSLATIQNKITAREFYTAFLYCYVNSSIDERSKFFRELYESVKEKEEFTNSTDIVVIFWHIVASLCYLKRKNELPFDFEELPEVFKKKILEMEKEVFEE
jgi:GTPase SAR1 family protein